ncbi:MAG: rhomboid family intramembrane serine protease [Gaiellales bacterium]
MSEVETPHCYRHPGRETRVSCSECGRPICEECMVYAPVGIKCPEHAAVGAPKPSMQRTIRQTKGRVLGLDGPATVALVVINVIVFLITVAQGNGLSNPGGRVFVDGALIGSATNFDGSQLGVANGEWWRLVTAMFLHGSIIHLFMNMLGLYLIGTVVEQALGTWRYLLVYFAAGLAGSALALWMSEPNQITVGASGAIYGVLGALLILEYMTTGSLAGQALTILVLNFMFTLTVPNISIGGHLGGAIGGILATAGLMRFRYNRRRWLAPASAVLVAIAAVALAYVRTKSYT